MFRNCPEWQSDPVPGFPVGCRTGVAHSRGQASPAMGRTRERLYPCEKHPDGPDGRVTKKVCLGEPKCAALNRAKGRPPRACIEKPPSSGKPVAGVDWTRGVLSDQEDVEAFRPGTLQGGLDADAHAETDMTKSNKPVYAAYHDDPEQWWRWVYHSKGRRDDMWHECDWSIASDAERAALKVLQKARNAIVIDVAQQESRAVDGADYHFCTNKMLQQMIFYGVHPYNNVWGDENERMSIHERLWGWGPKRARPGYSPNLGKFYRKVYELYGANPVWERLKLPRVRPLCPL